MGSEQNAILRAGERNIDNEFIASTFKEYEKTMYAVAFGILKDKHLAEDAVQDAFVALIKYEHKVNTKNDIKPLLITVVKNKACDIARKRKNTVPMAGIIENAEDYASSREIDSVEFNEATEQALALLPKKLADVFILYYREDMPQTKIAEQLGINCNTVSKRLQRARESVAYTLNSRDDLLRKNTSSK